VKLGTDLPQTPLTPHLFEAAARDALNADFGGSWGDRRISSAWDLQPRAGWVIASKAIRVLTVLDPVDAQQVPSRSAVRPRSRLTVRSPG